MSNQNNYPEGEALQTQIRTRHRRGLGWRLAFQVSTVVGIIALTALLYNIMNEAFGLVAVENRINPDGLVQEYYQVQMLLASNTESADDVDALVENIATNPYAIGFASYGALQQNQNELRVISIGDGEPAAPAVETENYPLGRPLLLYTSEAVVGARPQVAAFTAFYLQHINELVNEAGYVLPDEESIAATRQAYLEATGLESLPSIDPAQYGDRLIIATEPATHPLTQAIADRFVAEGFNGEVTVEQMESTEALREFCVNASVDVVSVNRAANTIERDSCRTNTRSLLELRFGMDAIVVVTSVDNPFLSSLRAAQLVDVFTTAERWSDINADWPNEPIQRFIPGADSEALSFFTEIVFTEQLSDLPKEALVGILGAHVSQGLGRRLEREQRFFDDYLIFENVEEYLEVCSRAERPEGCTKPARSQDDVYLLVLERVVVPNVAQSWSLIDSLFNRQQIVAEAQRINPNADIEFRSWLTPSFFVSPQHPEPELAGVRTAILGSLWVILITILFSFPVGVGAAIYLEEYASDNWLNRLIQTNINNLAGVPSIIYGMLGLAIFVRTLQAFTSGAALGVTDPTTANGRTIVSAGLTLGLLILPIIIINAQEAIRAVPNSLRQASYGLGATKWQTVWFHVIPNALPGILTGTILSMSRAIGETAPLIVVGASTFITVNPSGPFSKFTTLPIQIFQWTTRPQDEFRNIAAAAIIILLVLLLSMNAGAVLLRNRFSKRLS